MEDNETQGMQVEGFGGVLTVDKCFSFKSDKARCSQRPKSIRD